MIGAYWIAHVTVTDPARYAGYMALAPAAFAKYGAQFLARGAPDHALEGEAPGRVALIGFETMDLALACYHSPEYVAARAAREGAADVAIVIMQAFKP